MLKQYYCPDCGVMCLVEEETAKENKVCCDTVIGFEPTDNIMLKCPGYLLQHKPNAFPANLEIIAIIADLTTKLAFAKTEVQNILTQKAAVQGSLNQTTKALQESRDNVAQAKEVIEQRNATLEELRKENARLTEELC